MKIRTGFLLSLTLLILVATFAFGILTKKSFRGTEMVQALENYDDVTVYPYDDSILEFDFFPPVPSSVDELAQNSSVIIQAKGTNQRVFRSNSMKVDVEVEKVLKGDLTPKETIHVMEPSTFVVTEDYEGYYRSNGYRLIEDQSSYILFLNPVEFPVGYKKNSEEEKTFLPSSPLFAKYPLEHLATNTEPFVGDSIFYGELHSNEIITMEKEDVAKYNNFAGKVLKTY